MKNGEPVAKNAVVVPGQEVENVMGHQTVEHPVKEMERKQEHVTCNLVQVIWSENNSKQI